MMCAGPQLFVLLCPGSDLVGMDYRVSRAGAAAGHRPYFCPQTVARLGKNE